MPERNPIFDDIERVRLEEVKRRVLADPAVLEERDADGKTPLIYGGLFDSRGEQYVDDSDDLTGEMKVYYGT